MAVPMTVKMPEPMTAPMPSAVSDHGPRVFRSAFSGSSESRISLSIDLRALSCLIRAVLLVFPLPAERIQFWMLGGYHRPKTHSPESGGSGL